jgi:hypothetical protein
MLLEQVPRDGTWDFPPRIKIRICAECNSEMGRVYEKPTAPILRQLICGQSPVELDPRSQTLIGRWSIKTIILLHMKHAMTLGKQHMVDAESLLQMNRGGLPPEASSVRIARYVARASDERPGEGLRGSMHGARPLVSCSHAAIGHLAIEVLSGTPIAILDFQDRTQHDDRFVRVWPPRTQSVFAPIEALTPSDVSVMGRQLALMSKSSHHYDRSGAPAPRTPRP